MLLLWNSNTLLSDARVAILSPPVQNCSPSTTWNSEKMSTDMPVTSLLSGMVRNQPQMHSAGTRGVILRDAVECYFPWRLEGSEGQSNLPEEKITIVFTAPQLQKRTPNPNCSAPHKEFPLISRHPMHLKRNPFLMDEKNNHFFNADLKTYEGGWGALPTYQPQSTLPILST